MAAPRTKLIFSKPRFAFLVPDVRLCVMLPAYDRRGPFSLRDEFSTDDLPVGKYRLFLDVPHHEPIRLEFEVRDLSTTSIKLRRCFTRAQLSMLKKASEPPIIYLSKQHTHEAHFWIGHCDSRERFAQLMSEEAYWALEDEAQDKASLTEFIGTQNKRWYDHDFLEAGYETEGATLGKRFAAYSWSDSWSAELDQRARELNVVNPNSLIMLGGSPGKPSDWKLDQPQDVQLPGVDLRYVGTITFQFY